MFSLPRTLISGLFTCTDSFTSLLVASSNEREQMFQPSLAILLPLPKYTLYFIVILLGNKKMSEVIPWDDKWLFSGLAGAGTHLAATLPCKLSSLKGSKPFTSQPFSFPLNPQPVTSGSLKCSFMVVQAEAFCWHFCR